MSSAYDDDDLTSEEEDIETLPAGFSVSDNPNGTEADPNDPEVDLEGTDLADFTFDDSDFSGGDEGGDAF